MRTGTACFQDQVRTQRREDTDREKRERRGVAERKVLFAAKRISLALPECPVMSSRSAALQERFAPSEGARARDIHPPLRLTEELYPATHKETTASLAPRVLQEKKNHVTTPATKKNDGEATIIMID